jgi:hypothetical protein
MAAAGMQEWAARDLTVAAVAIITAWVAAEDWWLAVGHYRGATARTRARRAIEAQIRQLVDAGLAKSAEGPRRPRVSPEPGRRSRDA